MQKLQNICKYSLNLGHTDTITLKKERDQYGKAKSIRVGTIEERGVSTAQGRTYSVMHKYNSGYWEIKSIDNPNFVEVVKETDVSKKPLDEERRILEIH
ncbi:hypothetical protein [Bacillus sp. FJAT-27231]|uniref:hypothetical protein n=1 Tax=Bacillus sp. FJAT-27231 TaxID=1679168 RepID=UPI000AA749CD|nr:hypothetical protein [Bacillus sp. FJAT-27231]